MRKRKTMKFGEIRIDKMQMKLKPELGKLQQMKESDK